MDLIGSIKYIESRFGGRKHNQRKSKPEQQKIRSDALGENGTQPDACYLPAEYEARLGRKVNVTV